MKIQVVTAIAMLAFAGASRAGTDNFVPNTGCTGTACTPYTNDNPALTVSFVNPYYGTLKQTIVTVNGVVYRGPAIYTATTISRTPYSYTAVFHYDNIVLTAPDGSTLLLTMDVYYTQRYVPGGHPYYAHSYTVLNGTVTTS